MGVGWRQEVERFGREAKEGSGYLLRIRLVWPDYRASGQVRYVFSSNRLSSAFRFQRRKIGESRIGILCFVLSNDPLG